MLFKQGTEVRLIMRRKDDSYEGGFDYDCVTESAEDANSYICRTLSDWEIHAVIPWDASDYVLYKDDFDREMEQARLGGWLTKDGYVENGWTFPLPPGQELGVGPIAKSRREPDHAPFWWEMKAPKADDAMAAVRALAEGYR